MGRGLDGLISRSIGELCSFEGTARRARRRHRRRPGSSREIYVRRDPRPLPLLVANRSCSAPHRGCHFIAEPAATYSPGPAKAKYHRRCGA